MKDQQIPVYVTFTNWAITVLIGSILLPVGLALFGIGSEFSPELIGLSIIISALTSVPALLVLYFTHLYLNRNIAQLRKQHFIHNGVHLVAAVLTFAVLGFCVTEPDYDFLLAIAVTYTSIGLITWNVTYLIYRKKADLNSL